MSSCQAGLSPCSGTSGTDCRGTCPLLHCGSWRLPVRPHCHLGGQYTCAWPPACLHGFHRLHCSIGLHLQITSARVKSLRISGWRQQSVRPSMGPFKSGARRNCTGHTDERPAMGSGPSHLIPPAEPYRQGHPWLRTHCSLFCLVNILVFRSQRCGSLRQKKKARRL